MLLYCRCCVYSALAWRVRQAQQQQQQQQLLAEPVLALLLRRQRNRRGAVLSTLSLLDPITLSRACLLLLLVAGAMGKGCGRGGKGGFYSSGARYGGGGGGDCDENVCKCLLLLSDVAAQAANFPRVPRLMCCCRDHVDRVTGVGLDHLHVSCPSDLFSMESLHSQSSLSMLIAGVSSRFITLIPD